MLLSRFISVIWIGLTGLLAVAVVWGALIGGGVLVEVQRGAETMRDRDLLTGLFLVLVGAVSCLISMNIARLFWSLRDPPTPWQHASARRLRFWMALVFVPGLLLSTLSVLDREEFSDTLSIPLLLTAAWVVFTYTRLTRAVESAPSAG